MSNAEASTIIKAFDDCLIYIYGQRYARDNPHKDDMETANGWVKDGLTSNIACFVFFDRMSYMHEKHLRHHDKGDRSNVPGSLKLFDENIASAIRKSLGAEVDEWEKSISLWRSRCFGWQKEQTYWRHEIWGAEPFMDGCRVPHSILKEIRPKGKDYEKLRTRALDKRFEHLMQTE